MGRTQKSIKNIAVGIAAQIVTTIVTFITRSLFVKMLGDEVNSLNGLFHEVVMNLSLAELGIGSAIVYNLYKPLAVRDENKISELMTFYKNVYRVIAAVLMGLGAIVCIFVPVLVKDLHFTNSYMRMIFMLFVVNISTSYLFSYKISLLGADQNNYLYSFYNSLLGVFQAVVYVIVLILTKNYVVYLVANIVTTLAKNYYISLQIDKRYPFLTNRKLPKEDRKKIFDNVKNIFIKEVSGKVTSSTDNILISVLVSSLMVGNYYFYSSIITVFKQLTERVDRGLRPSMGNLFAIGDKESCKGVLNKLTWGYGVFSIFCATCFFTCVEPFISFWVGPKYILDKYVLIILTLNLFAYIVCKPIYAAMHVSGYFVHGRNISIAGTVINLIVSVAFGYYTGIFGIFLGTFCTYLIQTVLKVYYIYKLKFNESSSKYLFTLLYYTVFLGALMALCGWICSYVHTGIFIVDFLICGVITAGIVIGLVILIYHNSEYYKYYKDLVVQYLNKMKKKKRG
ncbi:MAG: lipopolysaccharide biosynthesis protein [Lachnospiraceae bacterium]|nr:lipopolysaccharide biosynthesis protein [Lachnospiraceae bacterium]MBR5994205.1 lipopolysaccharide biosynthesis protein [Lachnospiraceae bacterium]